MIWRLRTLSLTTAGHTLIMGVVNVTPDSFSDGGHVTSGRVEHEAAIAHGVMLHEQGADLVDVGGESTRPGSTGITAAEELQRVVPVVAGLSGLGVPVSIDTSKPEVAAAAIAVGAEVVNDVTGLSSPEMLGICSENGVGVVVMHMQGTPATMQNNPHYTDVVAEVAEFLDRSARKAERAGVSPDRICIDPGIGFGKTFGNNLDLLAWLDRLVDIGFPVMVGASRKGFLGAILDDAGHPAEAAQRDPATGATVALAIAAGASVVRVHNVAASLQSARAADAIVRTGHS